MRFDLPSKASSPTMPAQMSKNSTQKKPGGGTRRSRAAAYCLALAAIVASLSAATVASQHSLPSGQEYRIHLAAVAKPPHVYLPLLGGVETGPHVAAAGQTAAQAAALSVAGRRTGYVQRVGEELRLDGLPYTFVGTNVHYLAGPFFPEEEMAGVISFLAANGVEVIRVFVEPWCDLNRVQRMLDLGGQYGLRFILTLQDFYGRTNGWWFKAEYQDRDLPHIRNIVPLLADRPEVLMWELMNEPLCPPQDANEACWQALYHWAQVTSQEIKRLDPNHLVSAGTYRAGFEEQAVDTFRRIQALETIDVVSVHGEGGKLSQGERALEQAIAHELGKPIYFGEVHILGLDKQCRPLSEEVLQQRAESIAADLGELPKLGIDGYLLWQYAYGGVDMGTHTQYFCGELEYYADDPAWQVIREHKQG
jgi:hypothetical protein